jgi:hypothetical protein
LKDAKVCYRQEQTEEGRHLLELAALARARELDEDGLRVQAIHVAEELLALGVTEPTVKQDLPQLLARLGLLQKHWDVCSEQPEAREQIRRVAADAAVLRPDEAPAAMPEIGTGALAVRAALEAVAAGDDDRALEALREISRGSPFADWKLFVRGLIAYYRQEPQEMSANWGRLDPHRAAARIAAPLKLLAIPSAAGAPPAVKTRAELLERQLSGSSGLTDLRQIQAYIASGEWQRALALLPRVREPLRQCDPKLLVRLTQVFYAKAVRDGSLGLLDVLSHRTDPLPLDPHWHRARALIYEHDDQDDDGDGDFDPREAEKYWGQYRDDVAELPSLSAAERSLARALVSKRIGDMWRREADYWAEAPEPPLDAYPEEFQHDGYHGMRRRAIAHYEQSIATAPQLSGAYEALAAAYLEWDLSDQAAATLQKLLEVQPDNLEALKSLVGLYVERDEPILAREYVHRALRLQPLDQGLSENAWSIHCGAARRFALAKQWEQGRQEFVAARAFAKFGPEGFHLLLRQAIFEQKAGVPQESERLIAEARALLDDPLPLYLGLLIQAIRYKLPKKAIDEYRKQWEEALKKKCTGSAAGRMSEMLAAYLESETKYPGRAQHVDAVTDYLDRTSRTKYQPRDLRRACKFLELAGTDDELLEKLVARGRRLFPNEAFFQYMTGELEYELGPFDCNRKLARKSYEWALELAEKSDDPEDRNLLGIIRERLALLNDTEMPKFPFFGGGPGGGFPGSPGDLFRELAGFMPELGLDPDELPDEEEFADLFAPRRRAPKPKKPKK